MSIKAFPLNQQEYSYNAQDVMKYYAGRNSGVFETGDNLKVSANGGLEIRVNSGMGWLSRDYVASVAFWNESVDYLMVDAGHDTYDRVDLVVVSWNFVQQEQNPKLIIRKGTPASSPAIPSLVNNSSTIEIALARINVGKGDIELSNSDIVDLRGNDTYCPMVYDEQTIREAFRKCVGFADGVNKISDFPSVTPASSDKILIEQGGEGKSATIADAVNTCALTYEQIMSGADLNKKVASASAVKGLGIDLIWAMDSGSFEPQTISLDLSQYRFVDIECAFTQNISKIRFTRRFPIGFSSQIEFTMFLYDTATEVLTALNGCYRVVTVTTTGITFGNGQMIYDGTIYKDWPGRCIPLKIYGVK